MHGSARCWPPTGFGLQKHHCNRCMALDRGRPSNIHAVGCQLPFSMEQDGRFSFQNHFARLDAPCLFGYSKRPCRIWRLKSLLTCLRFLSLPKLAIINHPSLPIHAQWKRNPGIRLLIQHGRFHADDGDPSDYDAALADVQRTMRDTCAKHGFLRFTYQNEIWFVSSMFPPVLGCCLSKPFPFKCLLTEVVSSSQAIPHHSESGRRGRLWWAGHPLQSFAHQTDGVVDHQGKPTVCRQQSWGTLNEHNVWVHICWCNISK